jgi:hypothetical protein
MTKKSKIEALKKRREIEPVPSLPDLHHRGAHHSNHHQPLLHLLQQEQGAHSSSIDIVYMLDCA